MTTGEEVAAVPDLPYVDEHAVTIAAPPDVVWRALLDHATGGLLLTDGHLLARLLGTEPPAGFEVADQQPPRRLTLAGRHRFSRYRLVFELAADGAGTRLRALTYAAFPGLGGRAYRLLVISSGGHAVATAGILRAVRRRCEEAA